MVPLLFVVINVWVYTLTQAEPPSPGFFTGKDEDTTDMYGTLFVFPQPHCAPNEFYKIQLISRGFEPVALSVQRLAWTMLEEDNRGRVEWVTDYGELQDGNSTTLVYECSPKPSLNSDQSEEAAAVELMATDEILVHVLQRNDSYAVPPTNTLGTSYTIVSLVTKAYTTYFLTVTPVDTAIVLITEPNGNNVSVNISKQETYTLKRKASLTGTKVTSDKPILVISGMSNTDSCEGAMVEHVRPDHTWGSLYLLPLPYDGKGMEVLCVAYALDPQKYVTLEVGSMHVRIRADGKVFNLNKITETDMDTVRVSSREGEGFLVLFLISSPLYGNVVDGNRYYSFRLTALLAPASVHHYLTDPCTSPHLNIKERTTVAVGVKKVENASDTLEPVAKANHRYTLDKFWVRTYDHISAREFGVRLSKFRQSKNHRIWFQEWTLLKRTFTLYYLERGSHVNNFTAQCSPRKPQNPKPKGDRIDNDCDGFFDEELPNKKDDDGDGLIDEDYSPLFIRNCAKEKKAYLFELNRYRLTRFEAKHYEFARRLPKGYTRMVGLSALVGVILVIVFILSVFLVDMHDRHKYPKRPPKIF